MSEVLEWFDVSKEEYQAIPGTIFRWPKNDIPRGLKEFRADFCLSPLGHIEQDGKCVFCGCSKSEYEKRCL